MQKRRIKRSKKHTFGLFIKRLIILNAKIVLFLGVEMIYGYMIGEMIVRYFYT